MADDAALLLTLILVSFGAGIGAFWGAWTSEYPQERLGLTLCGLWLIGVGLWLLL